MGVGKGFDAADSWNVALLFLIYAVLSVGIEHGVHWIKTKVKGKKTLMLVIHKAEEELFLLCLLYTSPSPRDATLSRMPSSA